MIGNGIELETADVATTAPFEVPATRLSFAAVEHGLILAGQTRSSPPVVAGGTETVTGRDGNPLEVTGTFNAVIHLRDTPRSNNLGDIDRAAAPLNDKNVNVHFARAELGARRQGL